MSLFEVNLRGFEPHTFHTGAGYAKVKKELREAILREVGQEKISESRSKIFGNPVKLKILFRLWRGAENVTDTRSKKDLDNLLKPVLDVLQRNSDAQNNELGLNIIENDKLVYELDVKKQIVERQEEEGVRIEIFLADDRH